MRDIARVSLQRECSLCTHDQRLVPKSFPHGSPSGGLGEAAERLHDRSRDVRLGSIPAQRRDQRRYCALLTPRAENAGDAHHRLAVRVAEGTGQLLDVLTFPERFEIRTTRRAAFGCGRHELPASRTHRNHPGPLQRRGQVETTIARISSSPLSRRGNTPAVPAPAQQNVQAVALQRRREGSIGASANRASDHDILDGLQPLPTNRREDFDQTPCDSGRIWRTFHAQETHCTNELGVSLVQRALESAPRVDVDPDLQEQVSRCAPSPQRRFPPAPGIEHGLDQRIACVDATPTQTGPRRPARAASLAKSSSSAASRIGVAASGSRTARAMALRAALLLLPSLR
jgi:hypothetical protein